MPPLIGGAIVALAYIGMAAAEVVGWTSAIVMAVVAMASAAASYALQAKAKAPGFSSLSGQRMVTARDSIRARDLVYGTTRKGGVVAFIGSHADNGWINLVIVLAGHEVTGIDEVYFNDELAFDAAGTAQGRFVDQGWGPICYVEKHLGGANQAASPALLYAMPNFWTADHRLSECAYLVVGLHYEPNIFRSLPNITAIVRGKLVYDPRTEATAFSANPALCLADYLHDPRYGLGAQYGTEISEPDLIAAANLCDEQVAIPGDTTEPRYACDGILTSAEDPQRNLEMLLSAMAGRLIYTGGQWVIRAAAYEPPAVTLDEGDLRGNLSVQTRQQRRDLCNAVRGVFVSPKRHWQITDFPPLTSAVFEADDNGERIWRDVELPFTISETMAQRLAKIELYQTREQLSVAYPCSLAALRLRAGDTVAVTNTRMGWTAKPFLVTDWAFAADQDSQGAPVLGCRLQLRETSAAVYDITADEQALLASAPDTNLPSPFVVGMPGVPSVTEEQYVTRDAGGIKTLARISWTASPDAFVRQYQVEAQAVAPYHFIDGPWLPDADFRVIATTPGTTADYWDITPGIYAFRVKAITDLGVSSAYATLPAIEIAGVFGPPQAVTGLTISTLGGIAVLRWDPHPDPDVRFGGQIVFRHTTDTTDPPWESSVTIGDAVPGNGTVALLPLQAGTYLAKARDSVGMLSTTAAWVATDGATILNYGSPSSLAQAPTFEGTHVNTLVADSTLKLDALGNMDGWTDVDATENWDASSGIRAAGTYTFATGFDFTTKSRRRLRKEIVSLVVAEFDQMDERGLAIDGWEDFDGTVGADADAQVWIRTTDDDPAGSPTWSAWNRLDSGEVYCRGVQCQARLSTNDPAYNIYLSTLTVHAEALA